MISLDRRYSDSVRRETARERWLAGRIRATLIACGLGLTSAPAYAELVLQVENATAQAGGTGSFDVVLSATSGSFAISGFSVELAVDPSSGITFTGASVDTTTEPYIFTTLQSAPPFALGAFPTTDFTVADADMSAPGYVTLSAGGTATLGIEHVTFAVAAGTPGGSIPVSIVSGINTMVLDVTGSPITFTPSGGSIDVSTSAVPEPSSVIMGLAAMAVGVVAGLRRRSILGAACSV
jgi:hypothetical protein